MPDYLIPSLLLEMFIVGYTPGPANLYAFTASINSDRKNVIEVWLGLLTGFTIAVSIMSLLTHFIGIAFKEYITILKYIGAGYIIFLAFKIWKSSKLGALKDKVCTYWQGVIVQLTNAKMLLFELTVFSTFVLPYSSEIKDLFIVGAWLLIAGPIGNLAWIVVGRQLRFLYEKHSRLISWISSISLGLCAIYIMFT